MAKTRLKVRGSQKQQPLAQEFTQSLVIERKNIKRIENKSPDGKHTIVFWEYDETRYSISEWYQKDSIENKLAIAELAESMMGGNW